MVPSFTPRTVSAMIESPVMRSSAMSPEPILLCTLGSSTESSWVLLVLPCSSTKRFRSTRVGPTFTSLDWARTSSLARFFWAMVLSGFRASVAS